MAEYSYQTGMVFTGVRAILKIDGVVIGMATDVSGSEEIEYAPVEVLGDIYTKEHVPVAYRVTLSASKIRLVGETLKNSGFFPKHGTDSKGFLQNILALGAMKVTLEDVIDNKVVATIEGVRISARSFTVANKGIVSENITMLGIRMKDESEIYSFPVIHPRIESTA